MTKFIKVEKDDIKVLAELAQEIWHEYWGVIISQEQINYMIENFQSFNAISNQIANDNYNYFFINENGKNVGYFGVSFRKKELFLSKLYIKNDYRRKGIGRKAFKHICSLASENNLIKIALTVNKYNTNTIKAYEKWGFVTVNSVVTDIGSGFVMDDYIMEFSIN